MILRIICYNYDTRYISYIKLQHLIKYNMRMILVGVFRFLLLCIGIIHYNIIEFTVLYATYTAILIFLIVTKYRVYLLT